MTLFRRPKIRLAMGVPSVRIVHPIRVYNLENGAHLLMFQQLSEVSHSVQYFPHETSYPIGQNFLLQLPIINCLKSLRYWVHIPIVLNLPFLYFTLHLRFSLRIFPALVKVRHPDNTAISNNWYFIIDPKLFAKDNRQHDLICVNCRNTDNLSDLK